MSDYLFRTGRAALAGALLLGALVAAGQVAAQPFPPSITNTVNVTAPDSTVVSATDTDTLVNEADLAITKVASSPTPAVGSNITFTLSIINNGPAPALAVVVNDLLPAGYSFVSSTPSVGTYNSGTGEWAVGDLANGAPATLDIVVTVNAAGPYDNTATATSTTPDPTPANNTATATPAPVAPQLTMTKTASAASFTVGVPASYTLQVSNTGTSATTAAATITDTIPTGLTIGTLPAGCTAAGQVVTCTVPSGLATGLSTSFIIPITPTLAAGASVTNSATVNGGADPTCPAAARCTSSVGPTPINAPQLTMTKTASAASFTVGVPASYTLQVSNTGTSATTAAATITDTIPTGLSIGTLPAGCTASGQTVTCTVLSGLATGLSTSFIIPITPTVAAGASVTNSATVNGGGDPTCPAAARCTSSVGPTPINAPQLTMTKTASAASFTVGVPASYTLQVSNTGTLATTAVATITDTIPTGLTIGTLPAGCAATGQLVTCTISAGLAAGSSTSFIIPITPTLAAGASVTNSATASGGGDATCPAAARCSSSVTRPVNAPQLTMTKTASAASFTVGVPASYTLQVSNTGTSATTAAATITDTIPTGLTIGTLPAGCTAAGQVVTCTVPSGLATGLSTSFIIPITPTLAAGASVTNTATASGGGDATCPAAARCTSSVGPTPINAPQLTMTKTASAASFVIGTPASYTLQVSNTGTGATTAVATITDTIPTGLTIGTLPAGCTAAGQVVTCTVPSGLATGLSTSFIIPITPTVAAGASVTNSATVNGGGDPTCPAAARCTSSVGPTPINAPQLTMTKTASAASFVIGTPASYTLQVSNTGTGATTAVATITDTIPTGLTIGTLPAGCTALGQTVTCTVPSGLAAGLSTSFVIPVTATELALPSVTNSATVSGGGDPTCPANSRCTSSVGPTPVTGTPSLTIDKTAGIPSGANAGSTIDYTFLVTNTGNVTITALVINDAQLDAAAVCPVTSLLPGISTTCTGTHTITQAEVDAGTVDNSATATGTPPVGAPITSPPDTTSTPIAGTPSLTIDKTAGIPTGATAGSTIDYTFLVTNTGNVTITALVINDARLDAAATCAATTLLPGISTTCTGTHTITQAEIDAGVVDNSATASGTPPVGAPITSPPDTTSTPIAGTPSLTIDKTAGIPTGATAGSTIDYTFLVTNTGNVTITALVINDARLDAAATCAATTLLPGISTTCTGTHTITQAEIDAGVVDNSATASGTPPVGAPITSPPDTTSTLVATTPALTIDKTAGVPSGATAGSTIDYTFLVTNIGNVTLTGVVVNDARLDAAATCAATTLLPGISTTCTGTHTITQAEVDAGTVDNTATATGTPPVGAPITSPPDTTSTPIAGGPNLTIDKTAGIPSGATAGSTIDYTFLVTNTGNVTITALVINDAQLDAAAVCPVTSLLPGISTTCTGTHTITQAELNAGTVNNSATATGTPPVGAPITSPPDTTSTPVAGAPSLTIDKTAGIPSGATAGSTIDYTFLVTNTGNVTITALVINDARLDAAAVCPVTSLLPGISTTCTGTHTITQAEIDAGTVDNSATATGTPPVGAPVTSPPDTTSTPVAGAPSLTIDKTAGVPSGATAGSTIGYTFLITNTGNVTLTGIVVNDARLDAAATCAATTLLPGISTTCTGTHTITQAEVDAGAVNNSATATGTPPVGAPITSPPDTTSTPVAGTPSLTIDKTAGVPSGATAGSTIDYTFLVTNTGNVTITALVINDARLDAAATCAATTLLPGISTTCTGTHTITQAEVDAGTVDNTATATGTPPVGAPITSPPDTTSTPVAATPALTIDKTAGIPSGATAGSTIDYTFLVTNTGNVTITALVINDARLDAAATCAATSLLPGISTTCTGTHTITQAEIDAGVVDNSATATGTPPVGAPITSPPDTTSTPVAGTPSLTIDKTAGVPSGATAGSTIDYTFLVTNTGNVTITALVINDARLDAAATCAATTLLPGISTTCTGTHTITQAEVDAGTVNNTATATGTPPVGAPINSPPDTTSTPIAGTPSLTIDKTAGIPSGATAGSTIDYTFLVTNTGNVTITALVINDAQLDAAAVCPVTSLLPGISTTCTGTHTITQAEVDAGTVDNTATASGTPPVGAPITSPPDTTSTPIAGTPSLTIDKTAGIPSGATAGSTIDYTFLVTNTGNVTITALVINDARLDAAATCAATTLLPGISTTCTGTHTITQAEIDAGVVDNSATASGTPPVGAPVTSPPDTTSTPIAGTPSLTIDKTAGIPSGATAGSTIDYTFLVTNTGNVTLTGIVVNDAQLDAAAVCPVTTLAPGNSTTCTGTHTITQAEVDAGTVDNTATATGTSPSSGTTTSPADTTATLLAASPALAIDKRALTATYSVIGQVIQYEYDVANTGNVTINGISVSDDRIATVTCPLTTLAPGESMRCTASYTVVAADLAGTPGTVTNIATATGTPVGGTLTPATDTVTIAESATPIVAVNDSGTVNDGGVGGVAVPDVLVNDTLNGAPATLGTVTITPLSSSHPNVTLNPATGQVTVAPGIPAGVYTVTYRICEILNPTNCSDAVVTVTVVGGDIAPIAVDDDFTGEEGSPVVGSAAGNDTPGNISSTYTALAQPANGTVVMNPDGSFTYTPNPGFVGPDSFPYQVCDADGDCATALVTINVQPRAGKLRLQKAVSTREVSAGSLVSYTLTVTNIGDLPVVAANVVDVPPSGFAFVPGSVTVVDADNTAVTTGTGPITFAGIDVPVGGTATIRYLLRAGAGLLPGEYVNEATVYQFGVAVSNSASAAVVTGAGMDPDFEQTRIWGKVFDDRNGDGWQDEGERGIPGVRLATVEGLVSETDAQGRFHIEGLVVSNQMRGQNFVVKVDKSTLPEGVEFTTANPLMRRITPAIPTRFDFGVRMPASPAAKGVVELDLGTVVFEAGSREVSARYRTVLEQMATQIREHDGGEVSIQTVAGEEALAFDRAVAVRRELLALLGEEAAAKLRVDVVEPDKGRLLSVGEGVSLGAVLFDTDRDTLRAGNEALLDAIARAMADPACGCAIVLTGHADVRGDANYNQALSLRRAQAVREAVEALLTPEQRARLRVETEGAVAPGAGK